MKTEVYKSEKDGRYRWRIMDGDDPIDSTKSFPNPMAAQKNLVRTIRAIGGKRLANPIPAAKAQAKPAE